MGRERESRGYNNIDQEEPKYSSFCAAFLKFRRGYYQEIDIEEWLSDLAESATEINKNLNYFLAVPASEIIYCFIEEGKEKEAFSQSPFFPSLEESQYFATESLFFVGFEIGSQKFKRLSVEESFKRATKILKKTSFLNDQSEEFSSKVFNEGVFLGKVFKGRNARFLKNYPFSLN